MKLQFIRHLGIYHERLECNFIHSRIAEFNVVVPLSLPKLVLFVISVRDLKVRMGAFCLAYFP